MLKYYHPKQVERSEVDFGTPAVEGSMVNLTIDGRSVDVPEGTSVMRAAMMAGVKIPKLCATDSVQAFGSCRLCLVKIEGHRGLPSSVRPLQPRAWWSKPTTLKLPKFAAM
jgi:formate dehydrogenase major subunit